MGKDLLRPERTIGLPECATPWEKTWTNELIFLGRKVIQTGLCNVLESMEAAIKMSDPLGRSPNGAGPLAGDALAAIKQAAVREEEARLMSAIAQSHDRAAFTEIFGRYAPKIKSFALRLGADRAASDEVLQEVMIAVWRRAETFDPQKASVATWIFTIARNKRYDLIRRAQRPVPDPADPAFEPEAILPQDEVFDMARRQQSVRAAVSALPVEQAKLVRLSFFEGKTHRSIADELELPLGTVKSRVRLALAKLRKAMEDKSGS